MNCNTYMYIYTPTCMYIYIYIFSFGITILQSGYRTVTTPPKSPSCYPFVDTPHPPPPTQLVLPCYSFGFLRILCKWNHVVCNPLKLTSFSEYNALEIHLRCVFINSSFLLRCCGVFYYMEVSWLSVTC